MAFDQSTRGRLQKLVNSCRSLLSDEFNIQLQQTYGLDPKTGEVTPMARLTHLDDRQRHTAEVLRQTLAHYLGADVDDTDHRIVVLDRMVREQAFTVLNRLAALLMMEARGHLIESVSKGYQSRGYQLYSKIAATALGETGQAYQVYLFSVFDELAQELPALFDRFAANGLLFPREATLRALMDELNHPEIEPLWAADETIGWIYQYFNSKEERKAMRDASQAPRNSRELAVRNQFFTPRYVVEFLVDNTLGRLWFNATGGQTDLRDRCQYLLVKPDEQPQAVFKLRDPRTLKLLDPACGSMHFGLYAFDLFIDIYQEAWSWEQQYGPGSLDLSCVSATQLQAAFKPLGQTYEDEAAFALDVPRLIIENNIYGVDIDPRAAQIATLALWLRAQRAWNDAKVKAKDRPRIDRGHVIAAIAPPAERELRQQFVLNLDRLDSELFEKSLQMLKGLPEMGVLLQVELELPALIRQVYVGKGTGLFAAQEVESWQLAEARLRYALTEFAQAAKSTYQGRLFAQDALQGLRLIDLCREVFDVVVMNPPFGALASNTKEELSKAYPSSKSDLLAIFVERSLELLRENGLVGAITSRAPFYLSSMESWRKSVVYEKGTPQLFADLGMGVMDDAMVEAAAYVLGKHTVNHTPKLYCLRALTASDKEQALRRLITGKNPSDLFEIDVEALHKSPGESFAYWIPSNVLGRLSERPCIDPSLVSIRVGMQTGEDWRFLRQWWEIKTEKIVSTDDSGAPTPESEKSGRCWATYTKTDKASPWFSPLLQVVKWINKGNEYKHFLDKNGKSRAALRSQDFYFKPGFSYMLRSARLVPYIVPAGAIPTAGRAQGFGEGDELLTALVIASSNIGSAWARLTGEMFERPKFQAGMVQSIPYQKLSPKLLEKSRNVISKLYAERRSFFEGQEPYREFLKPAFFYQTELASDWRRESLLGDLLDIELATEYGLETHDYQLVQRDLQEAIAFNAGIKEVSELGESDEEPDEDAVVAMGKREIAEGLISYVVGVCFGRWDVRIVNGVKASDLDANPFAPLLPAPPGMLILATEKEISEQAYPISLATNGILSSEDFGKSDLVSRIYDCFDFLSSIRKIDETLICSELGVNSLEIYVNRPSGFFADHLNRYTAGGRKAPIYWPLSTASGSYTLWVYYPSLTNQTLFIAINDFLDGPNGKLTQVSRECSELRIKSSGRAREEEKQYETLQVLEQELTDLRDTLLKIALTYQPSHDDGVQITAAPLWQLFRHKPWQKVLKDTWAKLQKGDYDWAHLAMAYWPERVREKCKTDKSIAIAHGLEDLYVEPEATPKKTRGKKKAGGEA